MPELITSDIYLVEIPIPIPLRTVNCYLIRGSNGWSLVDAGFHTEEAETAWLQAFADLGIKPGDISTILITHYHPDHFGAAGWLQQVTGAPVYMHDMEIQAVDMYWRQEGAGSKIASFFIAHGLDPEIAWQINESHKKQQERMQPLPELLPLAEGEQILLGDRLFTVKWTPGHTDGLAVFWCKDDSILLANDLILQKISPNITLWPGSRPNPLADYLASLQKVETLPARLTLTGHRQMLEDLPGRVQQLRAHHDERLQHMESLLGDGATAWEVCRGSFNVTTLSTHQIRFAMGETLAHLEYLRMAGRATFDGARYRKA